MENETRFIDTDLFLKYITNDVPEQAQAFEEILLKASKGEVSLITNSMVIAEIVWTLEFFYHVSREQIQENVYGILNTPGLTVIDKNLILQAILWYVEKHVDFIDAWNAAWMLENGIETIFSFDKKHFKKFDQVRLIVPGA